MNILREQNNGKESKTITNNTMKDIGQYISTIKINVNELTSPIKRQKLAESIKETKFNSMQNTSNIKRNSYNKNQKMENIILLVET